MTKQFTKEELLKIFQLQNDKILSSHSSGVDGIDGKQFCDNIENEIEIISRKINNGSYKFSNYKETYKVKSEDNTRTLCIPTQRDKFVLKILNKILKEYFPIQSKTAKSYIQDISNEYTKYECFIKVDVKNFFPSIDHKILLDLLAQKLPKDILVLIDKAIMNKSNSSIGIAQGLPISGTLADIYMQAFDKKYSSKKSIKYYRFVDDVLIFCTKYNVKKLTNTIHNDMKNLKLDIHNFGDNVDKSFIGKVSDGFQYLGYIFTNNNISVRKISVEKLYTNINKLFTQYKNKDNFNDKLFYNKLNNKITGVKVANNMYGWIGYFSIIDDMQLLFRLDKHIEKMCIKNGIEYKGNIKKVSRAYYELKKDGSKYIPYFNIRTKKVNKIIKYLEEDVENY